MIQNKTIYGGVTDKGIGPQEVLSNAIIVQAVKDYREARRRLRRRPDDKEAKASERELTRFFCSDYFSVLTRLDGPSMLQRLKEEK